MSQLEERLVRAREEYDGAYPGQRAAHLRGGEFPVTVRFSNGSGVPHAPDRARVAYHAVHAFRWTDAAGGARWVRCRWEPEAGVATVRLDDARGWRADGLQHELRERLGRGPVDDPTAPWPAEREDVVAGRLRVEVEAPDEDLAFAPTRVTDGIECAPDPLLLARSAAYRLPASRRLGRASQA